MGGQIQAAYGGLPRLTFWPVGRPQVGFPIVGWWIRADRMRTHEADTQNERHGEQ